MKGMQLLTYYSLFVGDELKSLLLTALLLFASATWAAPIDEAKKSAKQTAELEGYRLSAAQGNANAQFDLGLFYANGSGVIQDYAEALKWYRLAAAQGNVFAHWNLGHMYEHGKGVQMDNVRAHMWYNIMGLKSGGRNDLRISVEKRMTTKQIGEAQKLARECQARNFKGC